VSATPEALVGRATTVEDLARQVEELRAELRRAQAKRRDERSAEVAALREQLARLQGQVSGLYAKLGIPDPGSEPSAVPE
jgi:ribosomal protein L29